MSLQYNKDNSLENDAKSTKRDININKNQLKPIKINKSYNSSAYPRSQTIDIKNKNPIFLKKEKKLTKDTRLLNYLNFANVNRDYISKIKDLSLKSRNSDNLMSNDSSLTKSFSPTKMKLTGIYSPQYKKERINKFDDYIELNSLYKLPPLEKKIYPYILPRTINTSSKNYLITETNRDKQRLSPLNNKKKLLIKNNINNLMNHSLKINKKEKLETDKNNKYDNINSFMKLKYYEDVNEKFEKKLRDDSFIDRGIKDKIIKIGKVGIFWRNVFEYCGSFIFAEKFRNIKNQFRNKYLKNEGEDYIINKYNKTPNKILYTNLFVNRLIHYQNKGKKKI